MVGVAFIGCGFVADYYAAGLSNHSDLKLTGVSDRNPDRLKRFSAHHGVKPYADNASVLADPDVQIVLNLTNPREHFSVSRQALLAGKHVYSEKPLGMTLEESSELVDLAKKSGLMIVSAPCSILGEAAQTMWKAVREKAIGTVRLVYAEIDDGLVHRMPHQKWISASGAPWPSRDEFEVGCTIEHAGYYLTWLTAIFGPAKSVQSFNACVIPDKGIGPLSPSDTPDFSVACIQFGGGVVARITCSIVASHDHRLRIFGDDGVISVNECWNYEAPVYVRKYVELRRKMFLNPFRRRLKGPKTPIGQAYRSSHGMDFCRGVAEMASALTENRPCRLPADFSLHNIELVLAINSRSPAGIYQMTTTFEAIEPEPWA